MKRYRILTNGERFRVQRHVSLGPFRWWTFVRVCEIRETYPKVVKRIHEFDSQREADEYIRERLEQEGPCRRSKSEWRTIKKYSEPPSSAMLGA